MQEPPSSLVNKDVLRAAVKDELRAERRRAFFRRLGFAAAVLSAAVLLIAGGIGYVLAKSGIADVPVLSSRVYNPPVPLRVVYPLVGSKASDVMAGIAARATYSAAAQTASVYANEAELTTLLRDSLQQSSFAHVQAVITPAFIELTGQLAIADRPIPLLVHFVPEVKEGALVVRIEKAYLGALGVPALFLDAGARAAADALNEGLSRAMHGASVVSSVLEEGKIRVTFTLPTP